MAGSNNNSGERGKWTCAIAALLVEPTIGAAANRAGIGERTLQRWLKNPRFAKLLRTARRSVLEQAIGRLQQVMDKAVTTLERNLTCGEAGPEIRAAGTIIVNAMKGAEQVDVLERLEEIERVMEEQSEAPRAYRPTA
jgi:hypothetical protein